jgi:hypothetical protein
VSRTDPDAAFMRPPGGPSSDTAKVGIRNKRLKAAWDEGYVLTALNG